VATCLLDGVGVIGFPPMLSWFHRLMVRSVPSHGTNRSSNLRGIIGNPDFNVPFSGFPKDGKEPIL
jgi:hypothetical protein